MTLIALYSNIPLLDNPSSFVDLDSITPDSHITTLTNDVHTISNKERRNTIPNTNTTLLLEHNIEYIMHPLENADKIMMTFLWTQHNTCLHSAKHVDESIIAERHITDQS